MNTVMQHEDHTPTVVPTTAPPKVDREEFARLARRYKQLAHSLNARDQQEKSSLNKTLMGMYRALNPKSQHAWYEDFDVVLRQMRRV